MQIAHFGASKINEKMRRAAPTVLCPQSLPSFPGSKISAVWSKNEAQIWMTRKRPFENR